MTKPIENIIIVGGGTAGWLSALYLTTFLNQKSSPSHPKCNITLIESSAIPPVGVGEATIQNIRQTFKILDLDEAEWMNHCNATFKIAIKFVNWLTGNQDNFWHPFGDLPEVNGINLSHYLIKNKLNNPQFNLQIVHPEIYLCLSQKSPKFGTEKDYEGKVTYGYHLDAGLLAVYLREKAIERGVNHIVDKVQNVSITEQGFIDYLTTENNSQIKGELYLDCSGFRGLLINQVLGESFDSYSDSLLCDRAIAISLETHEQNTPINPYTTATALQSGWAWHTPLYHRSGNGYVYSSHFTSPEMAEVEFRHFLGEKAQNIPAKHLKMRIGKNHRTWVKNCVSIGLASGFIEPLESTGIYLIEVGIQTLLHYFPDRSFPPFICQQYNRIMTQYYEEIRDFIVFHYCTTQREDTPFWLANQHDLTIPESLQSKLDYFQFMSLNLDEFTKSLLFEGYSYFCILSGMNYLPQTSLPFLHYVDTTEADEVVRELQENAQKMIAYLPSHHDYLTQLHQGSLQNFHSLFNRSQSSQSVLVNQ